MRKFTALTKDSITGYQVILSECSYNMAMDWLERECQKYGYQIHSAQGYSEPGMENARAVIVDFPDGKYFRTFYYDEDRGYLLGE